MFCGRGYFGLLIQHFGRHVGRVFGVLCLRLGFLNDRIGDGRCCHCFGGVVGHDERAEYWLLELEGERREFVKLG